MEKDKNLKEKFLKVYANIPLGLRSEIICVLEDRPISWDVAFVEIDQDTPKSKIILEKLDKLKLI
jgi:hypothetical protein